MQHTDVCDSFKAFVLWFIVIMGRTLHCSRIDPSSFQLSVTAADGLPLRTTTRWLSMLLEEVQGLFLQ